MKIKAPRFGSACLGALKPSSMIAKTPPMARGGLPTKNGARLLLLLWNGEFDLDAGQLQPLLTGAETSF